MSIAFTIIRSVAGLLNVFSMLILVRCVMSFFPQYRYNKFVLILFKITEPVLAPVRVLLWKIDVLRGIPFDLSPIAVMFAIQMIIRGLNFIARFFLPIHGIGYYGNYNFF